VTGIVITGKCGILKFELTLWIILPNYTTSDARLCSSACFYQCSLMGCNLLIIFEGLQQIIVIV